MLGVIEPRVIMMVKRTIRGHEPPLRNFHKNWDIEIRLKKRGCVVNLSGRKVQHGGHIQEQTNHRPRGNGSVGFPIIAPKCLLFPIHTKTGLIFGKYPIGKALTTIAPDGAKKLGIERQFVERKGIHYI